jgi:hypothetical protein
MIPYSIKTGYNHINDILPKNEGECGLKMRLWRVLNRQLPFYLRKLPFMNNAGLSIIGFGET